LLILPGAPNLDSAQQALSVDANRHQKGIFDLVGDLDDSVRVHGHIRIPQSFVCPLLGVEDAGEERTYIRSSSHGNIMRLFFPYWGHDSLLERKATHIYPWNVAEYELTTDQAARRLGVSRPTVRKWLDDGVIEGRTELRGQRGRFSWRISEASVNAYLEATSADDLPGWKRKRITVSQLRGEVEQLRKEVQTLVDSRAERVGDVSLRTEVTTLREALMQQRALADAMHAADQARAVVVQHLLAALEANETADERRRQALVTADTIVGQFLVDGNIEGVQE
jgi:excisionase family DNA binding protein